ncbi:MAG: hypothetical protein ACR652_10830 [Methylocystis sp.]|uniref:hypothetical protein n=1 Tax=Methylocystis sp. TaxID=1911079 RepID=UPI003DA3F048
MYTYAQVEEALAKLNGAHSDPRRGAFRARLQHYRRIGLVQESPGKGKRVAYTIAHVQIWAFSLCLAQIGIDPTAIKKLVDGFKPKIMAAFQDAGRGGEDLYVVFNPWFLTIPVDEELPLHRPDFFEIVSASRFKEHSDFWIGRICCVVNISDLQRKLESDLQAIAA